MIYFNVHDYYVSIEGNKKDKKIL